MNDSQHNFFKTLHDALVDPKRKIIIEQDPSLAFPIASITALLKNEDTTQLKLASYALFGQEGILPQHFTEMLLALPRKAFEVMNAFMTLFYTRLIMLLYSAWQDTHFYLDNKSNPLLSTLFSFTGMAGRPFPNISHYRETIYYYSAYYAQHARSSFALVQMLEGYFELPIVIEHYQGKGLTLKNNERTILSTQQSHAHYQRLGVDSLIGSRIWDAQYRFQICIGPVPYSTYLKLLPNQPMLSELKAMVSHYIGNEYRFSIRVLLETQHIKAIPLREKDQSDTPLYLGWTTWLKTKALDRKEENVRFGSVM